MSSAPVSVTIRGDRLFIVFDHYRRGEYKAALVEAEPIAATRMVQVAVLLAAIHGQLANKDEARRALDRAMALNPIFLEDPRAAMRRHNTPQDLIDQVIDGLIKAGGQFHRRLPKPPAAAADGVSLP